MNESCHTWISRVTYECRMSLMHGSYDTRMSYSTYEWVVSPIKESCHIRWVMSRPTYEWVMSRMIASYVTYMHVITHIHVTNKWSKPRVESISLPLPQTPTTFPRTCIKSRLRFILANMHKSKSSLLPTTNTPQHNQWTPLPPLHPFPPHQWLNLRGLLVI